MIKKWTLDYPAANRFRRRRVYIYLPQEYEYNEEERYPVLYMFDGQNVFYDRDASYGKSWGLGKYLDRTFAKLIVVAVECNRGKDNERLSEYSPFDFSDPEYGSFSGRGEETIDWFVNVLKPKIDSKFRTYPDRGNTFVMGSSMGGLMSLYAVLRHNDVFSAGAALSPSIELVPNDIKQLIRRTRLTGDTVIYMDYGSGEFDDVGKGVDSLFTEVGKLLVSRGAMLTMRVVPYGIHNEATWEKQLPFAVSTLLYEP